MMKYRKKYVQRIAACLCSFALLLCLFPADISAADRNFNKKKTITITGAEDYSHTQSYVWIKYKAPNDGYITITATNKAEKMQGTAYATGVFRLYDSKKKTQLSGDCAYNTAGNTPAEYTMVYGVRKNTTYYLQVQAQGAVSVKCKL